MAASQTIYDSLEHGTLGRVRAILSEQFEIPASEIESSSRLIEDLKIDTTDIDYFALVLEEEFEIEISDSTVRRLVTVRDAANCVMRTRAVSKAGGQ